MTLPLAARTFTEDELTIAIDGYSNSPDQQQLRYYS
jgi:hypothetical protein